MTGAPTHRGLVLRALGALGALVLVVIAVATITSATDGDGNEVVVTVPTADGVIAGQHIRAAGTVVGEVAEIDPVRDGRAARVKLSLDDEVWPLPRGSRFTLRWGGTINLYNRYVALEPGPAGGAPMVRDGGTLPASAFRVPVEYGDLLNVFDATARKDLKSFLDRSGLALDKAGPQLERALAAAPAAVAEADEVLSELDRSRDDVEALIISTGDAVDAIQRADPGLGQLVSGAGTTLNALAADVGSLQTTLERAPATFRRVRATLGRADGTLEAAQDVTRRIGPGVGELRRVASPLNRLLGTLVDVGPDARATLATAGASAPDLTKLVARVGGLSPMLRSISKQSDLALNCIRPYSPEIASFGSLWGSALSNVDGIGKYIRATPTLSLPAPTMLEGNTSAQAKKNVPGLEYAFPRPPGTQAGQPWLLPECRAGADAFDPSKDPEARNMNPLMRPPAEWIEGGR